MVLCDGIHRDAGSGKHTILGTFSTIHFDKLPNKSPFAVYFAITDGQGEFSLQLRIVDAKADLSDDVEQLFETPKIEFECPSPLMVIEGGFVVAPVFEKTGHYICQLLANGEEIMERRLLVAVRAETDENEH